MCKFLVKVVGVPEILAEIYCLMLAAILLIGSIALFFWLIGCLYRMLWQLQGLWANDEYTTTITEPATLEWCINYPPGQSIYNGVVMDNAIIARGLLSGVQVTDKKVQP